MKSDFQSFLFNICNQEKERFLTLISSIGYMIHNFKNPSIVKAVVLCDDNLSEDANGRSGKSLIVKSLGYLKNVVTENGKEFKTGGQKK